MKNKTRNGILLAVLAAALYAINAPFSKMLLSYVPATLMAGFLYLGAGAGMVLLSLYRKVRGTEKKEQKLTKRELPYTVAMIALDIAAPIFLMNGIQRTTAANASLLNNFEIVATAVIAFVFFREKISRRLAAGIGFVTLACAVLSYEGEGAFRFSVGSVYVLLASVCWGIENNCTRALSEKDPLQIVLLKGIFSGGGSLALGLLMGESVPVPGVIPLVMLLGLVAYGLSIYVYVYAQRLIGAARTSAYYAVAPFIGSLLSLLILREAPNGFYYLGLALMLAGAWLASGDN